MALELEQLKAGLRVRGLMASGDVSIVAVEQHGDDIANVVLRGDGGEIAERLVTAKDLENAEVAGGRRWRPRQGAPGRIRTCGLRFRKPPS